MNQPIKQIAIDVSNNSKLTQIVIINLLEKLDGKEKRDFLEWLKIIRSKQQTLQNKSKYGKYFK